MDNKELKDLIKVKGNRAAEDEQRRRVRSDVIAGSIGYLVCIVLILLELIIKKQLDFGLCGVLFTYSAVGIFCGKSQARKWWEYVIGVVYSLLALFMIIMFLGTVVLG